jgi:hypothetical protein
LMSVDVSGFWYLLKRLINKWEKDLPRALGPNDVQTLFGPRFRPFVVVVRRYGWCHHGGVLCTRSQ